MKRMILSGFFVFGFTLWASAQTTRNTTKTIPTKTNTAQNAPKSKNPIKPSDTLNNRKIYHFRNGQRATPTGNEATSSGVGGGYAALGRDRAPAVKKDTAKIAPAKKSGVRRSNR